MQIAAIIVTYNRLSELQLNISNSLNQSAKIDKFFVIDNASSDGTEKFFKENTDDRINYVRLEKNIGGAGGFNYGLKKAFEDINQFDFFFLMDDDGRPDKNCLEEMLKHINSFQILGPVIYCDRENETHSPYTTDLHTNTENLNEITKSELAFPVHPFNGTLISRVVVEEIGYPKKDFFIWGDEQEYRLRWLKAGFKEASITKSKYYHPKGRIQFKTWFILKVPLINKERKYIYYRNQIYIHRKYYSLIHSLGYILRSVTSIIFLDRDKRSSLKGVFVGLFKSMN